MGIFLEIFQQVKKASFYYKIVCQIYNHTDRSVLRCNVIFLEILTSAGSQEFLGIHCLWEKSIALTHFFQLVLWHKD